MQKIKKSTNNQKTQQEVSRIITNKCCFFWNQPIKAIQIINFKLTNILVAATQFAINLFSLQQLKVVYKIQYYTSSKQFNQAHTQQKKISKQPVIIKNVGHKTQDKNQKLIIVQFRDGQIRGYLIKQKNQYTQEKQEQIQYSIQLNYLYKLQTFGFASLAFVDTLNNFKNISYILPYYFYYVNQQNKSLIRSDLKAQQIQKCQIQNGISHVTFVKSFQIYQQKDNSYSQIVYIFIQGGTVYRFHTSFYEKSEDFIQNKKSVSKSHSLLKPVKNNIKNTYSKIKILLIQIFTLYNLKSQLKIVLGCSLLTSNLLIITFLDQEPVLIKIPSFFVQITEKFQKKIVMNKKIQYRSSFNYFQQNYDSINPKVYLVSKYSLAQVRINKQISNLPQFFNDLKISIKGLIQLIHNKNDLINCLKILNEMGVATSEQGQLIVFTIKNNNLV